MQVRLCWGRRIRHAIRVSLSLQKKLATSPIRGELWLAFGPSVFSSRRDRARGRDTLRHTLENPLQASLQASLLHS